MFSECPEHSSSAATRFSKDFATNWFLTGPTIALLPPADNLYDRSCAIRSIDLPILTSSVFIKVFPVGAFLDKLRILRLRSYLRSASIEKIFKQPERSTKDALVSAGFSEEFIHRFFRPFFGGILLDGELKSSSRMFEFVFKMLSEGDIAVPARGMGAIPAQLASHLPADSIRLNTHAESLHENELTLTGGESLRARAIVVAADGPGAAHLVGEAEPASRSVTCFYFSADEPPVPHPMLVLNGDGAGPVNNFAVISQIAPSYAPAGKSLVSVTVLGTQPLTDKQIGGFIIAQM